MKETLDEFIIVLEPELEGLPKGALKPDVSYRDIEGWSSMHALIIMAFADTRYQLTLTGEELRSCKTIRDLYVLLKKKSSNS